MTKLEEIAEKIRLASISCPPITAQAWRADWDQELWRKQVDGYWAWLARAAVEAMREPSEAMRRAIVAADWAGDWQILAQQWPQVIDAILDEKPERK